MVSYHIISYIYNLISHQITSFPSDHFISTDIKPFHIPITFLAQNIRFPGPQHNYYPNFESLSTSTTTNNTFMFTTFHNYFLPHHSTRMRISMSSTKTPSFPVLSQHVVTFGCLFLNEPLPIQLRLLQLAAPNLLLCVTGRRLLFINSPAAINLPVKRLKPPQASDLRKDDF